MAEVGKEYFFRRVEVWDEEKQATIVFLTNHMAVLYGGGEPMLNPAIFEMIKFCRDRNIRVGFSTNGTMEQSRTQPQTSRRGFGLPDIRFRRSHQGELRKISQRREVRRNA